jgi:hypothetical protein
VRLKINNKEFWAKKRKLSFLMSIAKKKARLKAIAMSSNEAMGAL